MIPRDFRLNPPSGLSPGWGPSYSVRRSSVPGSLLCEVTSQENVKFAAVSVATLTPVSVTACSAPKSMTVPPCDPDHVLTIPHPNGACGVDLVSHRCIFAISGICLLQDCL